MEYRRKDMIGQEEEFKGTPEEIMLLMQYIDNKDYYYVWTDGGQISYTDGDGKFD